MYGYIIKFMYGKLYEIVIWLGIFRFWLICWEMFYFIYCVGDFKYWKLILFIYFRIIVMLVEYWIC